MQPKDAIPSGVTYGVMDDNDLPPLELNYYHFGKRPICDNPSLKDSVDWDFWELLGHKKQ